MTPLEGRESFKYIRRNEIMKKHCCVDMAYHANFECDIHKNPFKCPDKIIIFDEKDNDYGLIIHDGGTSSIGISFCPWCGSEI